MEEMTVMGWLELSKINSSNTILSEESIGRYCQLTEEAKKIDKELKELKQRINLYFDESVGVNEKGEITLGDYKITRQIRNSESYDDVKTVEKLEALNLNDCIEYVKKPDPKKIEAVITLGLLDSNVLSDCVNHKITQAIVVRQK